MKTILLIAHFMAIAIGTGMSITNYVNIRISAGEKGERRAALGHLRRTLVQFADVVIGFIWITGISLFLLLPEGYGPNAWFVAKIGLVVVLTVCHGLARMTASRMARTGDEMLFGRLEMLVSGVWLSALLAIILAVLAFEA